MGQDDAIRLGPNNRVVSAQQSAGAVRWRLIVIVLMRILSVMWMSRALLAWADILGAKPGTNFADMPARVQAVICAFAVLNCIVAVGLWLATSWGAAVWILMGLAEILIDRFVPETDLTTPPIIAFTLGCVVLYGVFSYLAKRSAR